MAAKPDKDREGVLVTNRKALRDFDILESMECGIVLQGTEVKALRDHQANMGDSFARIVKEEVFLMNMHVSPYDFGNLNNHEPTRTRKLLLHKKEIQKLAGRMSIKGLALIPLKLYLKNGKVKVLLALAKGKTAFDKRESLKRKVADREIEKAVRLHQKR